MNPRRFVVKADTFTEHHTDFNGATVELVKWFDADLARVRTAAGTELDLHRDELEAVSTCPGHGSDIVDGECPDCIIEADLWEYSL